MTKLYQKSEITFAILWIVAYVVLSSYADQLSLSIGIVKSVTAVLQIVMSLILFFWIRSNNLSEKYGFCKPIIPARQFLYYLPLVIIAARHYRIDCFLGRVWASIWLPGYTHVCDQHVLCLSVDRY